MSINQKDIFLFVKKYLKKNKNIVDISKSSICYFPELIKIKNLNIF